jgi:hypothetical protein
VRARRAAEAAEADDQRVEERRLQWQREGTYLSWAEIEAGEPSRGCGQPLLDGLGDWYPLNKLTPDQRAEYDRAEELYRERHRGCRSHRWSLSGHRAQHCGYCCPPLPLTAQQIEKVTRIFSSARTRPEDLDGWDLTLTCGHTVRRTQHRDHGDRHSWLVVECVTCRQRRGVTAQRIGPAGDPDGQIARDRLGAELAQAPAKLDKHRKATAVAEGKVAELAGKLEDLKSLP